MNKQNLTHIVVVDPKGEYWEGALVDPHTALMIEARGAVVLPTTPSLFRISGVGAFAKRCWGAGIPIDAVTPRVIAPLTIYVEPELRTLHWAACLVRDHSIPDAAGSRDLLGSLRLVSDTAQPSSTQGGVAAAQRAVVHLHEHKLDDKGMVIIRGTASIVPSSPGHAGVGLYGTGYALRLVWAAVSLSE